MFKNRLKCDYDIGDQNDPQLKPKPITDTFWFDGLFEKNSIEELIQGINMSIAIGNKELTVYFSSDGGYMYCLTVLSDFFNNLPSDIYIDFVVSGGVCSCGFYILLMINNPNINIIFDKMSAWGMIHLADSWNSQRGILGKENYKHNDSKFEKHNLDRLNKILKEDYLDQLDLSDEDREQIENGHDVYFDCEELERLVTDFHNKRYYTSDLFIEDYVKAKQEVQDKNSLLKQIESEYKFYTGKDIKKELKIK